MRNSTNPKVTLANEINISRVCNAIAEIMSRKYNVEITVKGITKAENSKVVYEKVS
jgi:hypothetical protein